MKTQQEGRRLTEGEGPMRYSEKQRGHRGFKVRNVLIFNFNPLAMLWHGVMSPLSSVITTCLVLVVALGNGKKKAMFSLFGK